MIRLPIILIDNGHGRDTAGKCSPDATAGLFHSPLYFREFSWARVIACGICDCLQAAGYAAFLLVKEENDVPLETRVKRVETYCRAYGKENIILVSIHVNAAPPNDGLWHDARGWSIYTSPGNTSSDILATELWKSAKRELTGSYAASFTGNQKPVRADYSDGDPDYEAALYLLRKTPCTAVLSENLFQDNKEDVRFLNSDEGKGSIIALHVEGIQNYIKYDYKK